MTNNFKDSERYMAVRGLEKAMEVTEVLLRNGYEVFIELDDADIWCVHYSEAKQNRYDSGFYRLGEDDIAKLLA